LPIGEWIFCHIFGTFLVFLDLVEQFLDFIGTQGATVSDFASLGTFDHFANFSGRGEFKFGTDWADFSIEEGHEFVSVGDGTSREIADQSSVALSGFLSSQDGENGIFVIIVSGPLAAKKSCKENSFEDGNTTKDSQLCGSHSTKGSYSTSGGR
jgi:hypothetical protein